MNNEDNQNPEIEGELFISPEEEQTAIPEFVLEQEEFNASEELDWRVRTGLDENSLSGAVETIIFMNDRPVSLLKIKDSIDPLIPIRMVHEAIENLQSEYEKSVHGIRLVEIAEGFQFRTKALYSRYIQNLFKMSTLTLGPSALEVLAIIAYKQPIPRNEVDRIRGVDSSHILRALLDRRLIKISGRSEDLGKPSLYVTTSEFLEMFNLKDISELPAEDELKTLSQKNNLGKIEDIKEIVGNAQKGKYFFDDIDELDELTNTIRSIEPDTEFTKSLKLQQSAPTLPAGERPKTAFDLLEEFIQKSFITEQNKVAAASDLLTSVAESKIVPGDLLHELHNVPEKEIFESVDAEDIFADNKTYPTSEENELMDALDQAYQRLVDENFSESMTEDFEKLDVQAGEIDQIQRELIENAKDFGLDLSFDEDKDEKNTDETT